MAKTGAKKTAAAAKSGSKVTFEMTQKKVTKGTVVFVNEEAPVTQLYVSKEFVDEGTETITVTLEK